MTKKKNNTARRRKKSNTTPKDGAKRSKTEEKNPAEYRNGILQGLRVILGKMDDKDLLAVMMYAGSMEEKQKSTTMKQPAVTATTTATAETTAIATATIHVNHPTTEEAANPTTEANPQAEAPTTTVPPSPQDPVIQLNRKLGPYLII